MTPAWVCLGYAYSIATPQVWNTHFVLDTRQGLLLVDVPADPHVHFPRFGLDPARAEHIVLTHLHPDHVSGLPLLLQNLALRGRTRPLTVHGPAHALRGMQTWLRALGWEPWPWAFPVQWAARAVTATPTEVLTWAGVRVWAAAMRHHVPTWGLRLEGPAGRALAYSADTAPNPALDALADGAVWLFHEATGPYPGHSTAQQAGATAARTGVGQLLLVHVEPGREAELVRAAQATFSGPVRVPRVGERWPL